VILPPKDKHRLYYPDYIEYALDKIKEIANTTKSFGNLKLSIRDFLESIPVVENTIKIGTYLFRARSKSDNTPYEFLSQITLRDKRYVKSFGRAHRPNQAIFYCSTNHEVAIREATQWHVTNFGTLINRNMLKDYNPHVKFVTVSIWKVIKDLKVASLFLNNEAMVVNPVVRYFGEQVKNGNINNWNEKVVKSKNLILEFFSNEFAKRDIKHESDYLLSAYYANEIYTFSGLTRRLDGVAYPTVALDYKGENIAITEDAYKDKMEFVTAYHNYVANIEFNDRPMAIGEFLETVDLQGDKLIWKDIPTGKLIK